MDAAVFFFLHTLYFTSEMSLNLDSGSQSNYAFYFQY